MQIVIPSLVIPSGLMYNMVPNLMAYVEDTWNSPLNHWYESHWIRVFPVNLDVLAQILVGECDNDYIINLNVL
jgi:hypothetical protein